MIRSVFKHRTYSAADTKDRRFAGMPCVTCILFVDPETPLTEPLYAQAIHWRVTAAGLKYHTLTWSSLLVRERAGRRYFPEQTRAGVALVGRLSHLDDDASIERMIAMLRPSRDLRVLQ